MQHQLPKVTGKLNDDRIENWTKREISAGRSTSRSKYFNPPEKLTKPKKSKETKRTKEMVEDCSSLHHYAAQKKMKTVAARLDQKGKDSEVWSR